MYGILKKEKNPLRRGSNKQSPQIKSLHVLHVTFDKARTIQQTKPKIFSKLRLQLDLSFKKMWPFMNYY